MEHIAADAVSQLEQHGTLGKGEWTCILEAIAAIEDGAVLHTLERYWASVRSNAVA